MPVYKRGCVRVGTFRNSTHVQMGYVTNTRLLDASSTWACDIYGGQRLCFSRVSIYLLRRYCWLLSVAFWSYLPA
jgi:hypothetical protein